MDSDTQTDIISNRKQKHPTFEKTLYYIFIGLSFISTAISQHDPQLIIGSVTFGILILALIIRIRAMGVLALGIIISLISVALITRESNQQVSSASFVNALLVALAIVAIALGHRLQRFFLKLGCCKVSESSDLESDSSNLNIWFSEGTHSSGSGDWSGGDCGSSGSDCGGGDFGG